MITKQNTTNANASYCCRKKKADHETKETPCGYIKHITRHSERDET